VYEETPDGGGLTDFVNDFLNHMPPTMWPRSATQRSALVEVLGPFVATWSAPELAGAVSLGLPEEVTHPVGLLKTRLKGLPQRSAQPASSRPAWCGLCDEGTRLVEIGDEAGTVMRCKRCHPLVVTTKQENAS
jgi:hypothetical protein